MTIDGLDFMPARFALELWRQDATTWPRCLFPIAYESQQFRWIELDGPADNAGGAIWRGEYGSPEIDLVAPTLGSLLAAIADGWDAGLFVSDLEEDRPAGTIADWNGWRALLAGRFAVLPPVNAWEPLRWPARWQTLSGLDIRDAEPQGATETIRGLKDSAPNSTRGPATIVGQIVALMGTADGSRITVDDGTAQVEVWVPVAADRFRVVRHRDTVELDVVLQRPDAAGIGAIASAARPGRRPSQ
jgi:hypothetical protein